MRTEHLLPLDILLYKGHDFVSWLIQVGTRSPYNHVAVAVEPALRAGIESNVGHQGGVRRIDLACLDERDVDVFRLKPEFRVDRAAVVQFLESRLGAAFDYAGVMGLAALKVLSFFTGFRALRYYNGWQKDRDYFCSELCYEAFDRGGVDIVPQVGQAETVSPADIAASERLEKILLPQPLQHGCPVE